MLASKSLIQVRQPSQCIAGVIQPTRAFEQINGCSPSSDGSVIDPDGFFNCGCRFRQFTQGVTVQSQRAPAFRCGILFRRQFLSQLVCDRDQTSEDFQTANSFL